MTASALAKKLLGRSAAPADPVAAAKRDVIRLLGAAPPGGELPADDTPLLSLVPDSFGLVEMALRLQDEHGVNLSQMELAATTTLGDLATYIARQRG